VVFTVDHIGSLWWNQRMAHLFGWKLRRRGSIAVHSRVLFYTDPWAHPSASRQRRDWYDIACGKVRSVINNIWFFATADYICPKDGYFFTSCWIDGMGYDYKFNSSLQRFFLD
jgi:hypothetical protein